MARKFSPIVALALIFAVFYNPDTFEPESIRGKRVLITGSTSDIGEEVAYQYSKLGASVVITGKREVVLRKVASKCKELGATKVEYVVADLAQADDRNKVVSVTEKHLGGLDHLILNHHDLSNTAGVWFGGSENTTALHREMNANFVSSVDLTSRCLPMLTASKGNVGVVSSLASKIALTYNSVQSANQFALQGFFSSLRQDLRLRDTGVSVTVCVVSATNSNDAASNLVTSGFPSEIGFLYDSAVNDTATAVIKGVTKEAYEIYYPRLTWFSVNVHKFIPGFVEDYFSSNVHHAKHTA